MEDEINRNGSLNNGRREFPDGKSPQSTRDKNQDTEDRENPIRLVNESIPPAMEMAEEDSGRTTSKNLVTLNLRFQPARKYQGRMKLFLKM